MATAEATPAKPFTTSMKNAVKDKERQERGEEPLFTTGRMSNQAAWDEAMRRIDENPDAQSYLIASLEANPRAPTPVETALLLHRSVSLINERNDIARQLFDAVEKGFEDRAAHLRLQAERLSDDLIQLEQVGRAVGTKSGQSLQARKMMANEDYTLAAMETRRRLAKGGERLTEAEQAQVEQLHKKIAELQAALDARVPAAEEKASRQAADTELGKMKERVTAEDAVDRKAGRKRDPAAEREAIIAGIRNVEGSDVPFVDLRPFIQKLAEGFVREGIVTRDPLIDAVHGVLTDILPDLTRRQTMDLISGFGDFKPLNPDPIKAKLRDLKGQMQQVAKLEDIEARRPLQKTGLERRTPSDEERRLIQQVEEFKRRYGVIVTDPESQLKSALDTIKTRLKNQITDLEYQIATRKKIVKDKTGVAYDAEAETLKGRRDALKQQFDEVFGKPEMTDEQRVKLAMGAVERSIADLEERIKTKDIAPRHFLGKTPVTPELDVARARRDALKEQLQELRDLANPKKTPEETALQSLKTRLTNQIADLQERLSQADFTPRPRRETLMDAEADQLRRKLDGVKREFNEALIRDRLARRSRAQKILAGLSEVLNLPRVLMTSFDLSAVLRQGGFIALGHPIRGAKVFPDMLRSLRSKETAAAINDEILTRSNAPLYNRAKLYFSDQTGTLAQMEEAYMSRWADKIPGIAASQRAFVTFLNRLRADSFDAIVEGLRQGETVTLQEAKAVANFINVATGRGAGVGKAAVGLNTVFFAPRYVASRFQLLAGQPLYRGTARTRKAIVREYGRFLVGVAVLFGLGMAAGGTVETDPRSSDFGKIRFGNTRIDPLTGMAQITVLTARLGSGTTKTLKEKIRPIRGPKVPYKGDDAWDVIARFVRSKLSPQVGLGVSALSGKDVIGKPVTLESLAERSIIPLSIQDTYEAMQDRGVPEGTALGVLSMLGMGIQTYEQGRAAFKQPPKTIAGTLRERFQSNRQRPAAAPSP